MKSNLFMRFLYWFTGKELPEKPMEKKLPSAEIRDYIASKLKPEQIVPDTSEQLPCQDSGVDYRQETKKNHDTEPVSEPDKSDEAKSSQADLGERNASFSMPDKEIAWSRPCAKEPTEYYKAPKAASKPFRPTFSIKEKKSRSETAEKIDRLIRQRDESFQQMLFREIDSRSMTDVECYQRAHMDRKTFSKIRGDINYKPKKTTAVSLALALRMTADETADFLKKAGYALSDSSIFDVIIQYYLKERRYDLFEINETLYYYDQPLLGTR